jgi:myo-inositol-1(or 4)-monophosphatase
MYIMKDEKLEKALQVAIDAAKEAGIELIKHYGRIESEVKSDSGNQAGDVVTKLDRQTERFLSDQFKKFDPKIGFRGEEFGVENHADTTWLVDPIDGTSHFVRGIPFCTTMIALVRNGEVVMSVINDFVRDEVYWAVKGKGAFKDGNRIHVSNRPLKQAVLSFETRLENPENMEAYLKVREKAGGTVSTVNCGFEFSLIASGKLDARITKDPYGYDWDYAPGTLIVKEAGGVVRNHGSDSYDFTNHEFIAANPVIFAELTEGRDSVFPNGGQY